VERPTGVTILAILQAIGGILLFIAAAAMQFIAALIPQLELSSSPFLQLFVVVGGVIFAIMGIVALILAYGFWTGKSWAWWLAIILQALGILSNIAYLPYGIVGIAIGVIIIYYLTRPHVREFFGT